MEYRQLVVPNLDPYVYQNGKLLTDWYAWCLATTETAFKAGRTGATAWDEWTKHVKYKHNGNPPVGVYVPIWFSGYSGMGHVAIYKDGKIWTSPDTHKPSFDTYTSIARLAKRYGVTYVGWSEDIGGTRVVEAKQATPEGGTDVITKGDITQMRAVMRDIKGWNAANVDAGKDDVSEATAWVGKTYQQYISEAVTEGAPWRKKRDAALAYYAKKPANDKALDSALSQVSSLTSQVNELQRQLDAAEQTPPTEPAPAPDTSAQIGAFNSLVNFLKKLLNIK